MFTGSIFREGFAFVSEGDLSRSFFIANFYTPNVVLFSVTFNTLLLMWGRKKRHDYSNIGCGVSSLDFWLIMNRFKEKSFFLLKFKNGKT